MIRSCPLYMKIRPLVSLWLLRCFSRSGEEFELFQAHSLSFPGPQKAHLQDGWPGLVGSEEILEEMILMSFGLINTARDNSVTSPNTGNTERVWRDS